MPSEESETSSTPIRVAPKRARASLALRLLVLVASGVALAGASRAGDEASIMGATPLEVITDPVALDHAVKSKIYPEDRNTMYVTLRGGGISVFDVSNPAHPTLRTRWSSDEDVEGQDRRGGLLVVVARRGVLLTFDVSRNDRIVELGRLELETARGTFGRFISALVQYVTGPFEALHVKLYDAPDGRRYALVTATATGEIIAVDVTEPQKPRQAGQIDADVSLIEGIYVHRDHAFVGGFGSSDMFRAVEVSNPKKMRIVHSLKDESYRQMVSEMSADHPDLLFAALWNDDGGLGVFDVSDPPRFRLVGRLVMSELARANRVKLEGNRAFLPLEVDPGGFAIVDVSNPTAPVLVQIETNIPGISTPYTLEVNRNYLYVFGSVEPKMAVFRLEHDASSSGPRPSDSQGR